MNILNKVLSLICLRSNVRIILYGDLNINNLEDGMAKNELMDTFGSYHIINLINGETRVAKNSATGIDYMCVNDEAHVASCDIVFIGLSDHSSQILTLLSDENRPTIYKYGRVYTKQNYDIFRNHLLREIWSGVFVCQEVNKGFDHLIANIKYYIEVSFPIKKIKSNESQLKKSWITPGIYIPSK